MRVHDSHDVIRNDSAKRLRFVLTRCRPEHALKIAVWLAHHKRSDFPSRECRSVREHVGKLVQEQLVIGDSPEVI